jgi:hypothetical protein
MQGRVVVSFARTGRSESQSFPRKRESTLQAIGNAPPTDWIPACAGMTSDSTAILFQMTPVPRGELPARPYACDENGNSGNRQSFTG